ncbi:hypothetical protein D3C72_939440 [compost metagenome]
MSVCGKMAPDVFAAMLSVGKDNGAIWPLFFDQRLQQAHFLFVGRIEKLFFNTMTCFLLRLDFHIFGVVHLLERQFTNAVRESRGEQHIQALRSRWHATEQPADVFDEAQIVHAICFIEYHNLDSTEVNVVLFSVINQAARGADKNINAAFQHFQLFIIAVTAISQTQLQASGLSQRFCVSVDLHRKFSRWSHDQRTRLVNFSVSNCWMRK